MAEQPREDQLVPAPAAAPGPAPPVHIVAPKTKRSHANRAPRAPRSFPREPYKGFKRRDARDEYFEYYARWWATAGVAPEMPAHIARWAPKNHDPSVDPAYASAAAAWSAYVGGDPNAAPTAHDPSLARAPGDTTTNAPVAPDPAMVTAMYAAGLAPQPSSYMSSVPGVAPLPAAPGYAPTPSASYLPSAPASYLPSSSYLPSAPSAYLPSAPSYLPSAAQFLPSASLLPSAGNPASYAPGANVAPGFAPGTGGRVEISPVGSRFCDVLQEGKASSPTLQR